MLHYKEQKLFLHDIALPDILQHIPTPFYIYDAQKIANNIAAYHNAFEQSPLNYHIHYAVKANSNTHILRAIYAQNMGMDVVSSGEIMRCLKADIAPKDIVFSGVGKTDEEILFALAHNIGQFNVESHDEINDIIALCQQHNHTARIALRVNPDIAISSHDKISTGKKGDKFGIILEEILPAIHHILAHPCLQFQGLAMHIGSQITDLTAFHKAYQTLRELVKNVQKITPCPLIDIGGGIGIEYQDSDKLQFSMPQYCQLVEQYFGDLGATIMLEPGRSIVGDAGYLVAEVIRTKMSGPKHITIVDAAMNDLIRPTLYNGYHPIYAFYDTEQHNIQDFVGSICETGDYLLRGAKAPILHKGDRVLFAHAGAYGAVMASSYNTRPIIAEYLLTTNQLVKPIRKTVPVHDIISWEDI